MSECCIASCPYTTAAIGAAVGCVVGFIAGRMSRKSAKGKTRPAQKKLPARPSAPRQENPAGSVEIYVGNLSYDMKEEDLRKLFGAYGEIFSARIVTNRYNDKSKGFGFVVMTNRAEAEKAVAELNGKDIMGRALRANEARNP